VTTVADIINDAFRVSNLVATGVTPNANEQQEALRHLNNLVASVFGNEVGENFFNIPIGRANIGRPQGYPWFDNIPTGDWFIPKNARLMANMEEATEVFLHPEPDDGTRIAVIDVARNFDTNPVTLNANGRRIGGQLNVVLNVPGTNIEWFYRGDLGEWLQSSPLDLTDPFPFPKEFDDFFSISLAMRLNPAYGKTIDGQASQVMGRAKSQIRARYKQQIFVPSEIGITRLPRVTADREGWINSQHIFDPSFLFAKGWPF
jgi:hypothetical protein